MRYAPLLKAQGATVIVECQQALVSLFGTMEAIDQLVVSGSTLVPEFDYQCSFLSLPIRFQTVQETVPNTIPYLQVPAAYQIKWQHRLDDFTAKKKIAIVWAGNKVHKNDKNRSCQLADFAPLFAKQDLQFFSCQVGERADELNAYQAQKNLTDCRAWLGDFADTAALLSECDLLISVDTSVAHLAGSLGVPVWLLVPYAPDWRWMMTRTDSPWYPSMTLFRQDASRSWTEVLSRVADCLR